MNHQLPVNIFDAVCQFFSQSLNVHIYKLVIYIYILKTNKQTNKHNKTKMQERFTVVPIVILFG